MRAHSAISYAAVVVLGFGLAACRRGGSPEAIPSAAATTSDSSPTATALPDTPAAAPVPSPLDLETAIAEVEEVRGSNGGVATPPELRHYPDTRRFLSLQMADAQEARLVVPHDDAELIDMIRTGKLVGLAPMTETYLLYEVGEDAKGDPLVHFDAVTNKGVPLLPSMEAVEEKTAELERGGAAGRAQKAVLDAYYGDPLRREQLFREYQVVAGYAAENGYSLSDPDDRARLQKHLLSHLRPEARDVLVKIAEAYHRQFGRRLPVTSVIRTERYQHRLTGVNPNATRVQIPPHGTGEAFDISYKYMASDEQNFVMDQIAQFEAEQKVEALRENRGAIHVYAFAGGDRPPEPMVESARAMVDTARAELAEQGRASKARVTAAKKKARVAKARAKATVKRTSSSPRTRAQRRR
jgi:hypothetical protein